MDIQYFRQKFKNHQPTMQGLRGEYAVLVPLVELPDGLHLLFEVRSSTLRHHAAEVCFPGGRMERGETPEQCALRETQEELGIDASAIEILGRLDYLYLRSDSLMHPVLSRMDASALQHMHLNRDEVSDTFLVPLSYLCTNPPRIFRYDLKPMVGDDFPYESVQTPPAYQWTAGRMEVPVYEGLPYPLWGLTARITHWLIDNTKVDKNTD